MLLFKNKTIKNIFTLTFGIGISQLIILAIQLITRRLFTPEEFGAFDVYFNIFGILVVVATLRYEMAVILPKEDAGASNITVLAVFFSFCFSFLIFLLLVLFRNYLVTLLSFPVKYSGWLFFLPITTFLFSSYQVINYWLIRKRAYTLSSFNKIARRSTEGIIQVILGYIKSSVGLVIGDLTGNLINFSVGLKQIFSSSFTLKYISKRDLIDVFKRYSQFPKYNLVPALLNTVSTALPFLIINKFYGGAITGYFGLSKMILAVPSALVSTSVSQVLLQTITSKRNSGLSIMKEINRMTIYLGGIAVIEALILSIWGVEILTFLFDKTWTRSGEFIQIVVYASAINFVVSPLSIIFVALEKLKLQAFWQISYFVLILSLALCRNFSIINFLYVYITIDIVAYTIYYIIIHRVMISYEISLTNQ